MKKVVSKGKKKEVIDKEVLEKFKMSVPEEGRSVIGIAKGVTLKVGDFEFVRLDVWGVRNIDADDEEEEFEGLSEVLDTQLQREIDAVE